MLTGTSARRSGPSDSPFASSQRRSAPATTARMTSLTVPRSARRILRISGRGRSSISNRRWGPTGRFNAEAGASPMPARPRSGFNPPAISRSSLREIAGGLKPLLGLAGMGLAPASALNRPVGPHRRFEMLDLPLPEIRKIRRALRGTVNDVILAVVAGALRRWLEAKGESLGQDRK